MPPKRKQSDYELELMKILVEKPLEGGKTYKEESVKTFVTSLFKVHQLINGDKPFNSIDFLKNYQGVIQGMKDKDLKLNTRISYYNAIILALKTVGTQHLPHDQQLIDHYSHVRDLAKVKRDASKAVDGNPPQQKHCMGLVSKEQIIEWIEDLFEESDKSKLRPTPVKQRQQYMLAMILYIHTIYPFRNVLSSMKIIRRDLYTELASKGDEELMENNWLVIEDGQMPTFVLVKYKTSKIYGINEEHIQDQRLKDILNVWISKWLNIGYEDLLFNRQPLLTHNQGTPFSSNEFSHLLLDASKKRFNLPKECSGISTTIMAKMFSLMPDDAGEQSTMEDLEPAKKQAKARGHSFKTKAVTYQK